MRQMDEGRKIRFLRGKGATDVSSRLPSSGIKSRRMSTDLVFPAQVVLAFATIGMLARWYVAPRLAGLPRESALQPLLVVQAFRYIGLGFLAPALVRPSLAQSFAIPAALGTTLAAVLALAAIAALRARSRLGIPLMGCERRRPRRFRQRLRSGPRRRRRERPRRRVLHPHRHRPGRGRIARDDPRHSASPFR